MRGIKPWGSAPNPATLKSGQTLTFNIIYTIYFKVKVF